MRSHKTLRFCPLPNVSITLSLVIGALFTVCQWLHNSFPFSRITRELTVTGSGKNLVVNKKQKKNYSLSRRDCLMFVLEREWGGKC